MPDVLSSIRNFARSVAGTVGSVLLRMSHGGFAGWGGWSWSSATRPLPGGHADYASKVKDRWRCSVVACALGWLSDNFMAARFTVSRLPALAPADEDLEEEEARPLQP